MAFKISVGNKLGERILLKSGNRAGIKAEPFLKHLCKRRRQNHIAYSYWRRNGFWKCIDINNLIINIGYLHGRKRLARKSKLAVIFILDDIAIRRTVCPFQNLASALRWSYRARWEMMSRWNVNNLSARFFKCLSFNAAAVHININAVNSVSLIDLGNSAVWRIFKCKPLVKAQKLNYQPVKIFRTRSDYNLRRHYTHTAVFGKIGTDCFAQTQRAVKRNGRHKLAAVIESNLAHKLWPNRKRKVLKADAVWLDIRRKAAQGGSFFRLGLCKGCKADLFCIISLFFNRINIALRDELRISRFNRYLAYSQMLRQSALWRQLWAAGNPARRYIVPYSAVKLLIKRNTAALFKCISQHLASPSGIKLYHKNGTWNNATYDYTK